MSIEIHILAVNRSSVQLINIFHSVIKCLSLLETDTLCGHASWHFFLILISAAG